MVRTRKCKRCNTIPYVCCDEGTIRIKCWKCGGESICARVHGLEVAIEDWNRWHGEKHMNKRVYEDDDWIIDKIDGNLRISNFKNNHFVDDIILKPDAFKDDVIDKIKNDDNLWSYFV